MKKKRIRLVLAILIILLIAELGVGYWVISNNHIETKITEIPDEAKIYADEDIKLDAGVNSLRGRSIHLQRYSGGGEWETIRKYKLASNIKITGSDCKMACTIWRLYVPEGMNATEAISNSLKLTSVNIEEPEIAAEAACIYRIDADGGGTVIYERNLNERRAQASITKLLTAMLLIDSGKLEDNTEISANAASTKEIYHELSVGDVYNNHDLMYAMLLLSANDAAVAIAEGVSGNVDSFVEMMNARSEELRLEDTHFMTPHGLDTEGHYSTALDVARLTAYAYEYPEIREAWTYKEKEITSIGEGKKWLFESTTEILGYNEHFKGGKTGTQPIAGYCFAGVYEYKGADYVTVVLGCEDEEERWTDTKTLHHYIEKHTDDIH